MFSTTFITILTALPFVLGVTISPRDHSVGYFVELEATGECAYSATAQNALSVHLDKSFYATARADDKLFLYGWTPGVTTTDTGMNAAGRLTAKATAVATVSGAPEGCCTAVLEQTFEFDNNKAGLAVIGPAIFQQTCKASCADAAHQSMTCQAKSSTSLQ
ncbi:uncharacterized protein L969DRAFT_435457 [Mixia osmundae IAM 14324]|uniref:Uncharacterized protein n=1 Tax=Mixia osmundae (strain CBS 9802 / IAM 14324 / JCM 22182 / KY 12970) TaxID=764103 RepID=G7DZR3_MIXOS|nr:uncharacterized protein L969DRAFT_435457 [Mixia osmundae IAM 14324]KEI39268.1 hypothetical protein L969DRAFT_435457 [Mixia osmundae IAM 14324]GAA96073.1 hypothetical protein E5Q_02734 [Mixia osmundae IAM 14324]